jgi:hypothetical protein
VLDRLAAELGPHRQFAAVPGDEIAVALRRLWGNLTPGHMEPQPGRRRVLAELVRHQETLAGPAAACRRASTAGAQTQVQAQAQDGQAAIPGLLVMANDMSGGSPTAPAVPGADVITGSCVRRLCGAPRGPDRSRWRSSRLAMTLPHDGQNAPGPQ